MSDTFISKPNPEPGSFYPSPEVWNRITVHGAEQDVETLRQNRTFMSWIGQITPGDKHHLTLAELRGLVQRYRQAPETWELPKHLASCPMCLELFEILKDEEISVSHSARDRYQRLLWATQPIPATERHSPVMAWLYPLTAIAAGVAIMATGAYLLVAGIGRTPGNVLEGSGIMANAGNPVLAAGAHLPARKEIVTQTGMHLALADGSQITVAPYSRFRLTTPWVGRSILYLSSGDVNLAVTKQSMGRTLAVQTPLGEVIVVGTRFRVKTINDKTLIYQQTAGNGISHSYHEKIKSVIVSVTEGMVKVRNVHDEVRVGAGHTAILRDDQPLITTHPTHDK